jgi:hypothetical protein
MSPNNLPYVFLGWDHPPQHCDDVRCVETAHATGTGANNAAGRVLWEIGLTLAVPLALAVIVETVLQAFHIA